MENFVYDLLKKVSGSIAINEKWHYEAKLGVFDELRDRRELHVMGCTLKIAPQNNTK
jgi:hypothetical protein